METGSGSYVLQAIGASIKESSENIRISMGRTTTKREMADLAKAIKLIYSKFAKA
jgi:cysteine sulfinate desulfinase/cysteine desulfurase-like protein